MSRGPSPLRMLREQLSGGLEVVVQRAPPSARSFSLSYVAPAGWGFEPPRLEGLAGISARLAITRPGGVTREALARTLDRLGATLTSSVDPESAEVLLWGPTEAWRPLIHIFSDAIFRPRFTEEELARTVRQVRERQLRQRVQPDLRAAHDLLPRLFPKGHPYRSTGIGTSQSVGRITPEAAERFHRRHYRARSSLLVVTAPAAAPGLVRLLSSTFPESEFRPDPSPPLLPPSVPEPEPIHVPIPGQSQVAIRFGAPSIPRSDPEYPALFLLNEVLGGRPLLSRLFQRVRERHGLAYHASSDLEAMRWGGYWEAVAGTDPSTRDRVVRLMRAEVHRLISERIPTAELDRIRESAIGSLPLELETTASAHELAVEVAYHHLPVDFFERWPATLRGLSARELQAAAETGFRPADMAVVTAGPPVR